MPLYQHARWSMLDGAPADIWALSQSEDDMLWLGTGSGLYRFDGHAFSRPEAPVDKQLARNITALAHAPDRTLWIGYFAGGVSALRDGRLHHYPAGGAIPAGMVFALAPDRSGRLWMASSGGLAVFDGGQWQPAAHWGYAADHAYWVLGDRRGDVWVATGQQLVRLPAGERRFVTTGIPSGRRAVMAESPSGQLWISDTQSGTRPVDDRSQPRARAAFPAALREIGAKRLWFSADGTLWGTDDKLGGVFRAAPAPPGRTPSALERFGEGQGLTSNVAVPGLADKEGNLWVGTNLGLNRFRRRSALTLALEPPLSVSDYSWALDPDGRLHVKSGEDVFAVDPDGARIRESLPASARLVAVGEDSFWAIDHAGILRKQAGAASTLPLPGAGRREHVLAFALSADQTPHVVIAGRGLYALRAGRWHAVETGRGDPPTALAMAAGEVLWLGHADGSIVRIDSGGHHVHGPQQGLQAGEVTAMTATARGLLVAGDLGLAWQSGERFRTLPADRLGGLSGVTGIAMDADDVLWLNGITGATRVTLRELDRAFETPGLAAAYRIFDAQDGLPGVAIQSSPVPTALGGPGRVWLATNAGLAWVSEAGIQANGHRPRSMILGVRANGVAQPAATHLQLPAFTTSLQVDFTAASLSTPQRTRFRHRLEGLDDGWHESLSRQALYSNLRPGRYRFVVAAANSDGLWSDTPAVLDLSIDRTFWQSTWFALLCAALAMALLSLAYWHHLRQYAMRMRARVAERYLERERIARELHDTLLQGLQGLILRLGSIAMQLPASGLRHDLENAIGRAEEMLVESRDRLGDLRAEAMPGTDIRAAFARIGEEMALDSPARLDVVSNRPMRLLPTAYDEIYRIGREAVLNAYKHADAQRILVRLDYQPRAFTLQVHDDGIGLAIETSSVGRRRGHWGLSGMQERADRIGARLRIEVASGSRIDLVVPARHAYGRRSILRVLWGLVTGSRSRDGSAMQA